jgi:ParB family protein of integrating conjugative element (PFGI_1 class)
MTRKAARHDADAGEASGDVLALVTLDVARIHPYEHNPRRAPNTEYDRIKASIRADGLSQPLVVTQRPGETDYIVHAGGNTRLRILKELFEETGDRRFATVPCAIRSWTREADVLLAHLKENDLRGDLTFLDKALAVADAKQFLEEVAGESFTQAQLAEALRQCGYGLSQGLISQMAYAVDRLRPILSQALEGGIGRPQVARIRSLERAARAIWVARSIDTEIEYDQTFEALCQRYDAPEWDIASLRRALEAEIAERADISIHAVSLEIDARLSGRHQESFDRDAFAELDQPIDEHLALVDRLWFGDGSDGPLSAARRALTEVESDLEGWERRLAAEQARLVKDVLGVGAGDDVVTESRGRVVRLRLEGTTVHVSEKVVNFHLWGMRYRKDGLPGKRQEYSTCGGCGIARMAFPGNVRSIWY